MSTPALEPRCAEHRRPGAQDRRTRGWLRLEGWAAALAFGVILLFVRSAVARASEPNDADHMGTAHAGPGEARVVAVAADLVIHRGGTRLASGRRLGPNRAVVEGVARYELEAHDAPRTLVLLDFAEHLREEPKGLDEVQLGGYADGPWTHGGASIQRVVAAGTDRALSFERRADGRGWEVEIPTTVSAVRVHYRVDVPRRYWPFGCANGRCSLSGAVAPLPSTPAFGGVYLPAGGRVVAPASWDVRARFADVPNYGVAGSTSLTPGAEDDGVDARQASALEADRLGRDEIVVVADGLPHPDAPGVADAIEYPIVVWGRGWERTRAIHRGVEITVLHIKRRPDGRHPEEGAAQLRRDLPGRVLEIAGEGLDLVASAAGEFGADQRLVVVQGPLRSQIAEFHPGAIYVSDQAFEIFPAERFFKFHALIVARAVLEGLSHAWLRPHQRPDVALWLGGATGFALVNVWQTRRELRDEYAQDLLRNFTFVPAVDRFLYTEQAQFSGAYFRGSDDELGPRNHPLWFAHALPTGRRIHEKLVDLLSAEQIATIYGSLAKSPGASPQSLVERAYGRRMGWFFDQWLGPYPDVDYAVVDVTSSRLGRSRRGPWRHRIEVVRDAAVPVLEPVQVLVTDVDGNEHFLVWNGDPELDAKPGAKIEGLEDLGVRARHVFEVETAAKLKSVRLDPRVRLEQTSRLPTSRFGRPDNNDPRFNDRVPPKFRFIYTGFGLSVAASELLTATTPQARINAITAFASFEGSLRRDLRRTGSVSIRTDREAIVGATAGANFYFLAKRNKQRRRLRLRSSFGGALLTQSGLDPEGGVRLTEALELYDDTRAFGWWPEKGHIVGATVAVNQTLREQGDGRDDRHSLAAAGGWTQMFRLARDHVLATTLDMAVTFPLAGTAPEFRNLVRLGGIGGLAGYTGNEILGKGGAWVQAEYRHLYVNDLPLNFAHLGWLRGFGGVAFGGAGTISACESFDGWFGADSWYGQVGYGLQAQVQALGVSPQLIRLDVAVPLVRRRQTCLGEQFPDYLAEIQGLDPKDATALLPPVTVNLVFNHPF